jgi:restriction system protein
LTTWMVRSEGGALYDLFRSEGVVALGWDFLPSLTEFPSRDALVEALGKNSPDEKPQKQLVQGAQLWRFAKEVKLGDGVVTYNPTRRVYSVGKITSAYSFDTATGERLSLSEGEYPHVRRVDWNSEEVSRDSLSVGARNTLGSTLSFFRIPENVASELTSAPALGDLNSVAEPIPGPKSPEPEVDPFTADELAGQSRERIKDMVVKLDWKAMQELIAGLLRAMGYRTRVSPEGADRGKDIVASPDGLGFEDPRIVVEVKHRPKESMGGPAVRSFLGGRQTGEKGLYVSTGGFTKDARYEAERANVPLTLLTLDEVVDLLIENYDRLDDSSRILIPLRRFYWPTT